MRRVKTQAGSKFFGVPIGAPITGNVMHAARKKHGMTAMFDALDHEAGFRVENGIPDPQVYNEVPDKEKVGKAISPGGRPADDSPFSSSRTDNWVARAGGLPKYIREVAHALVRSGHPESEAISMAVGIVQNWASGKGKVRPQIRAAAAKAVAEWEAKRGKAHVTKRDFSDKERADLKAKGKTDAHGGFPLVDRKSAKDAVQAIGRAKNPDLEKKRIIAYCKQHGYMDLIPDGWSVSKIAGPSSDEVLLPAILGGDQLPTGADLGELHGPCPICGKHHFSNSRRGKLHRKMASKMNKKP